MPNPIHYATLQEILYMASFNPSVDAVEFLFETIDYYLEEAPRLLEDIQVYQNQTNYNALRRAAHTLSSTSATLGAVNLAAMCTELEILAVNEKTTSTKELISQIQAEYQRVNKALEDERQKYASTINT
jgi:HPt (histidine-containing phosphotransfer) domain-containing protein